MNDENRLLMSESLKGMVPELEEDALRQLEDTIVVVSFHLICGDSSELLTSSMLGAAIEDSIVKVDFRTDTSDAYKWLTEFSSRRWTCARVIFTHCGEVLDLVGPFDVKNVKLTDIDRKTKTSTIGIDLFRS